MTELERQVLQALHPTGFRERVLHRSGWTVAQVLQRISDHTGPYTMGGVRKALDVLVSGGVVRTHCVTQRVGLVSSGDRNVVVDLYRLA